MSAKIFTYEEISEHNTAEDLWMVIDGKVYACTPFLDEHPGGEEVMVDCGGTDATGPFDDIGHSEDAKEALIPLYIGDVDPESEPVGGSSTTGSAGVTGGEQNLGLIIAIIVIIIAILAYFVLLK